LNEIRVRRSGLITFAIRLGSTITGLVFVVLVTSHLTQSDFGLWQLISRVIGYVIFVANILNFWTIRYRARGTIIGKTVMTGAALFSLVLSLAYILVSVPVSGSVNGQAGLNLYYFLISAPQVALYVFSGVLEAILWGSVPEKASFGFGIFEISKVIIGGLAVAVFHLSLTGAIIAIIGAQIIQIITIVILAPHEYEDRVSFFTLSKMIKTGWLALLNQLTPLVVNFDFLIVAVVTGSTIPLALYGVAFTYGTIITYSGWIAYGLYAGILAGVDARRSTTQVLELQYLFIVPMVLGEILLSHRLLYLFKPIYVAAAPILVILAIAGAFSAMSQTFDNVITAVDTTDATTTTQLSVYLESKLFLVAKINIIVSSAYLAAVALFSATLRSTTALVFGYQPYTFIGIMWASAAFGMWSILVLIKQKYVRQISKIAIPWRGALAIILGGIAYSASLIGLDEVIPIHGDEVIQALLILLMGGISLTVYACVVLALNREIRRLTKYALRSLFS
jgi:O-antigen/teichoic acid export membrane protein